MAVVEMNKYQVWYGGPTLTGDGCFDAVVEVEATDKDMARDIVETKYCSESDEVYRVERIG